MGLCEFEGFGANISMKEFTTKVRKKTTLNYFKAFERTAAALCLTAACVMYNRQLLMRRLTNGDAILNICCNNGCSLFSINSFMLNDLTFYDCCSFLFQ